MIEDLLAVGAASVRLYAALLLGWAAIAKLRRPDAFEGALAGYRLLPAAALGPAARTLPWLEGACALLLLAPGPAGGVGAWGAAGLFGAFGAAVALNLARGRRVLDCGCGGPPRPAGPWLLVHNLLLTTTLGLAAHMTASGVLALGVAAAAASTAFLLNLAQAEVSSAAARRAA